MSSKDSETNVGIDYKFWIILALLLVICSFEIFRTYKMNNFSHRNGTEKMMDRRLPFNGVKTNREIKFQNTKIQKGLPQEMQQPKIMQERDTRRTPINDQK
ncbi:MAG: hypothetical protein PHY80_04810 [Rickettsiales bacterium]|nr:hypothetical protein [Rickettsiales bacterium]